MVQGSHFGVEIGEGDQLFEYPFADLLKSDKERRDDDIELLLDEEDLLLPLAPLLLGLFRALPLSMLLEVPHDGRAPMHEYILIPKEPHNLGPTHNPGLEHRQHRPNDPPRVGIAGTKVRDHIVEALDAGVDVGELAGGELLH